MSRDMRLLIGKLGPAPRSALEKAASATLAATHFTVELEHLLLQLLQPPCKDVLPILKYYELDVGAIEADLRKALEPMKRGNGRTPALSPRLLDLLEEAWVIASVQLGHASIRSGTLLAAALSRDSTRSVLIDACPLLLKIPRDHLAENLGEFLKSSAEDSAAPAGVAGEEAPTAAPGGALDQYTQDLTALARAGKMDPIVGRDSEIRQVIDILMRRRQNNPILTGEPGVGKTAVAEGFAQRIAAGTVPEPLKKVVLRSLDLGLLQAGAGLKGEFEQRLKNVISEVAASPVPVILFVDEAHTLIGAGGAAGQADAANLLKPALARGELRTIAATTWAEYKRYVEKDPALARRFQVVKVAEPDDAAAVAMLRGVAVKMEQHHGVRVTAGAIEAAVKLTSRYITGRQQPDKALSVLDTACARVAVARDATPAPLEAVHQHLAILDNELIILHRESAEGISHHRRLIQAEEERILLKAQEADLQQRWEEESAVAARLRDLLRAGSLDADALMELREQLVEMQGETPLVPVEVDGRVIADVVAAWTGIPVGRMMRDDISLLTSLEARLERRVVGQPQALEAIATRLRTYHAGLAEPGKPIGVFLLCGPTGVGKTETALALAELMYGGDRGLTTINMSEFQEPHTVALLKGSPPGYVGYGQGGVLTEAVRRAPYSLVLLDEIEKAHPDVCDLFYQVFDKGRLEDAEGTEVDFRNTVICLTSNLGAEAITQLMTQGIDAESIAEAIRPVLLKRFKPAFLSRMTIVPYGPLTRDLIEQVLDLKLSHLSTRLFESHGTTLTLGGDVRASLLERCLGAEEGGARLIDHVLGSSLQADLADLILEAMAKGDRLGGIFVSLDLDGRFSYEFTEAT
ncbi:type VI secretion system ATPase TssH [Lacibacterium aquatile]|uniref:Type VI secretion system ATPase TssH n=1 Tax=Lacibacterium aquatile TaxID=1168082 RepID=A0ABW5DTK7_9PROT